MHPNQIACAWLWICLRQNCQISFKKYSLLNELLISKYWRQNISVSNIASHTAVRHSAHRAHKTVHLLTHETPDFITPALWPANSPDLNPVDYQIWGRLQERVYLSQIRDVDQPKSHMIEEWEHFNRQVVIDKADRQRRPRLGACVRLHAHGGHFEHRL